MTMIPDTTSIEMIVSGMAHVRKRPNAPPELGTRVIWTGPINGADDPYGSCDTTISLVN